MSANKNAQVRHISKLDHGNVGWVYILPWLIGFLIFKLYPFVASFIYSFTQYDILGSPQFIGIRNYIDIFSYDRTFSQSIRATFIYVLISVPGKMLFSLFVAMLLNYDVKGSGLFKTIYYMPAIFGSSVGIAFVWRVIFATEGPINSFIKLFGAGPVYWLASPKWAIVTLSLLSVWQLGTCMVIFLSGLKQVPGELYEAARVEGATPARCFISITVPLLSPIVLFNLVMQMVWAFQEFTGAFVITNGGPMKSTYLYAMKLYDEAFLYYKMGYASSLSWILFIIIVTFTLIVFKSANLWVFYSDTDDGRGVI